MRGALARLFGRHGTLRGRRPALFGAALAVVLAGAVVLVLSDPAVLRVAGAVVATLAVPGALLLAIGDDQAQASARLSDVDTLAQNQVATTARLDALEQVLADATRRPWSPTLLPWQLAALPDRPVVLLPGADYHLPEVVELAQELERRGVPSVVACGRPHWDRTAEGLVAYPGLEVLEAPTPEQLVATAGAVVTMKDWAGYQPLVVAANDAGIPTFAKVEGVQDYHDVDTADHVTRAPYRTAATILCQGRNDAENLPGDTRIVGSTRLERLWWAPPTRVHRRLAVINLNFTYGVLTAARDEFLSTAVAACERAGIDHVISLHPAERVRTPHPRATSIGISRLLERASVLITRFSTAGFEALARGVPLAYHNPHGEQVATFQQPDGAFDVTRSVDELAGLLDADPEPGQHVRERAEEFFSAQVDLDPTRRAAERAADVVLDRLGCPTGLPSTGAGPST